MSDRQEGVGWWRTSDGRWHPPEEHPAYERLQAEVANGGGTRTPGDAKAEVPAIVTVDQASYWAGFSPPALAVVVVSAGMVLFSLAAPTSIMQILLVVAAGVWGLRTVVRVREGYGAWLMSIVAITAAVLSLGFAVFQAIDAAADASAPPPSPRAITTTMPPEEGAGATVMWTLLEAGACVQLPTEGRIEQLVTVSCDRPHDAQVIAVERSEEVSSRAVEALLGSATEGLEDPDETGAPSESQVDPVESAMTERCEELGRGELVAGAPPGLVIGPIYTEGTDVSVQPVLLCLVYDIDGGRLLRDFVD